MKEPLRTLSAAPPRGSLATNVVEFCRLLQHHGIAVAAGSALPALRALKEIDLTRRRTFRSALRISLIKRPTDIALFNDLFDAYWRPDPEARSGADDNPGQRDGGAETSAQDARTETATGAAAEGDEAAGDDADRYGQAAHWGARTPTPQARGPGADTAELDRIARALAAELAIRRSRRKQVHRRGDTLDFRRAMRNSIRHGGLPVTLPWRRPRITRAQLLIFCDVSRSMAPYAQMLLQFASAVLRHAWRVEVFLFASHLLKVSDRWSDVDWDSLTRGFTEVGGGTRIGASLTAFLDDYAYCLTGNKATVLILSDGLDAGEPKQIAAALARIRRRARQVIWLNPLLATSGYEPTARGMAAALPYIDVFAPAHDAAALRQMTQLLRHADRARGTRSPAGVHAG